MFIRRIAPLAICLCLGVTRLFALCTVMEFNIEDGGTLISLPQVIKIIQAVDPDIVCIEEAEGNIPLIAAKLGWNYYDTRQQILSRFPIIDPPEGKGIYIFVEMSHGKYIAISNVHLPSKRYGPDLIKQGKPHSLISRVERKLRLAPLKKHLKVLSHLAKQGSPVILTGDFNAPSYLDWTIENAQKEGVYEYAYRRLFIWPTSLAVAKTGFRDSYREVHPNPLAKPGYTWWADRPVVHGWNPDKTDPLDRIDFIYVMGPAKTISSECIGPCGTTSSHLPWPSDHCALVSTFDIAPCHEPIFVAVNKRLISIGERLSVSYNAPHLPGQKIVIICLGKNPQQVATNQINHEFHGTFQFSTEGWSGHSYEVQLLDNSGAIISKIPFFMKAPDEQTTLSVKKRVFDYKEPIVVHWRNGPGNRWDWIGIFKVDHNSEEEMIRIYTETEIKGRCKFNAHSWSLPPGRYKAGYFIDESSMEIAQVQFTIN
jgi:exonuclease III